MNSAAVIGRQLRQHQTSSRVSGPVVPPTQYRGRAQASFAPKHDRDFLSVPSGVDADKKFAKFSQLYSTEHHTFYPHPAHRNQQTKTTRSKEKKKKSSRIQCTWHCVCVAFKALSSGIILLLVGTTMSAVGFFADTLAAEQRALSNGTVVTVVNRDTKSHLHNLTYVGPVIMGLGGIVIVAACVLTFEVRDTLGVKDAPPDQHKTSNAHNNCLIATISNSQQIPHLNNNVRSIKANLSPVKSNSNANSAKHNESVQTIKNNSSKQVQASNDVAKVYSSIKPAMLAECPLEIGSDRDESISQIDSGHLTDVSYLRIPSPQDIELSDPDGCSLVASMSKWKSRCSCSGSPTNSMVLALHNLDDLQTSPTWRHTTTNKSTSAQLPPRYSRILASVESDGLSSVSSHSHEELTNSWQRKQMPVREASRNVSSRQTIDASHIQPKGHHGEHRLRSHERKLHTSKDKPKCSPRLSTSQSLSTYSTSYPLLNLPENERAKIVF